MIRAKRETVRKTLIELNNGYYDKVLYSDEKDELRGLGSSTGGHEIPKNGTKTKTGISAGRANGIKAAGIVY